jgi:hypothetical protein
MLNNYVSKFREFIEQIAKKNDKVNNVLCFRESLCILFHKIYRRQSYSQISACNELLNDFSCDKSTITKARNKISENTLNLMISFLINEFCILKESHNPLFKSNRRYLAVDGTYIALDKSEQTYRFVQTKKALSISALISCIYDITNNVPVAYHLHEQKNERAALVEQLLHIRQALCW